MRGSGLEITLGELGRLRELVHVAKLYYEQDLSEAEIAAIVQSSRSTVSRMLSEAKRRGIVKITFASGGSRSSAAGSELQRAFGLRDIVVVPAITDGDDSRVKGRVGAAGASYLSETVRPGDRVGISWGTTLLEVALRLRAGRVPGVCVVQLNGCVGQGGASYLGAQVLQLIAEKLGARAFSLPAPSIVRDPAVGESFRNDPSIAEALELARGCDIAVFTVGLVDPACILVSSGYLSPEDMQSLEARGAVGDICSRFFDRDGRICDPALDSRTLGLPLSDLAKIPLKVLIAGGIRKAAGILGALRGGYVDVLITDETTVREVMHLA